MLHDHVFSFADLRQTLPVKRFQPQDFFAGLVVTCIVAGIATVAGGYFQRTTEVFFWATMGAMTAFLCAVGEPLSHPSFLYAWPVVGALTAASAILLDRYHLAVRMGWGACLGGLVMALCGLLPQQVGANHVWVEIACAPVAGAIMVGVVWILETIRSWQGFSRAALKTALAIGVIGGNLFGRWVGLI